jgi:tetratricopeptide (TPR) repeat protein
VNTKYQCPTRGEDDIVHRYVAGTLETDELEVFEIHLIACAECERAVREGLAIRSALGAQENGAHTLRLVSWVVPIAAAAACVWLLLKPADPLRQLGRVDTVPAFDGIPVRADADSGASLANRGMAAYADADFRLAAELLTRAVDFDPTPAGFFFLGIARLKISDYHGAMDALSEVADPPDNPYAAEAHLYCAKAWLSLGYPDSAFAHLELASSAQSEVKAYAFALADSLRDLLR